MKPAKLLLIIIFPSLLLAAGPSLMAQSLGENDFVRYTTLQGLSNNYISGIVEDSAGFLWVATHKGLNRFDGKRFLSFFSHSTNSPLPDNLVVSMRSLSYREVLGATRAGAFAFDPITNQSKQFVIPCDSSIFFWTNHTLDIVKDKKSNYVISTKTGLYIFNDSARLIRRYDYHTPSDVGRQELIFGGWVNSLADGSTLQQNGQLGSVYDPATNQIDTLYIRKKEYLRKAITDAVGNMRPAWCGRNGDLVILNLERNSLDVADLRSPRISTCVMPFDVKTELGWASNITFISDSSLVITCKSNGFYVLHYDPQTHKLSCNGKKYFEGNVCTTVFKDRENRLWIGTADGLYKQNLNSAFFWVTDLSQQSPYLIDHEIRCLYTDGPDLFAGLQNEGGLLIVDKKTGNIRNKLTFLPLQEYSNDIFTIFHFCNDTVWVGTDRGIVWVNTKNYHYGHVQATPSMDWVQRVRACRLYGDSKGNVWVTYGKLNGLLRYNRDTRTFMDISPSDNPLMRITYVFSLAEDLQGNIWLAGDGLCRWNMRTQHVDTLIPYPRVSGLLRNYMYILDRDDKNNLWLSSYGNEIIQYNCTTHNMYLRQKESNFVDGNTITSSPIINGYIWMGTDNGISAFNINDHTIKQFTYADGLPSVAITSLRRGSFYDKATNRFYMAARHRLISFIPDASLLHKVSPGLFIERINVRDSVIIPREKEIRLKYFQNNATITFNTINFTDPEENRYAWRMLDNPSDTGWNDMNDQTVVTLTNLIGGRHIVQLKLFSANNRWPQQIKTLGLYVQPPYWKTTWFRLLMALLGTGLIVYVYKSRVNAIRKKERDKAQVQQLIAEEYKNRLELEQIINYFSSSLTDKLNVDDVLWDVTQNLISRLGYSDCIIYLWNRDKTKMIQKAAYGPKGSPVAIATHEFDVAPGQGVVGHVMQTARPIVVPDTRKDKRYRVDDMPRLSEISVPIMHNDELLGIIDSEHHIENYFKDRDVKILTTIATLVGNKLKQIESEQSLQIKQKEIAFINQQLAEAQLSALQTQMNPHFIFNCLNSIKGMILNDEQQKASRYLSKFANMIRTTLNQSKEVFTTLYENIEHLENYLAMEKLRFDDSFNYQVIVDENIDKEEILIPTLMIQPLAENAIWHGLMYKSGDKNLVIRFFQLGEAISCSIEDNGIGINRSEQLRKASKSTHRPVGLNNLRNRIKIMNEKYDTGCTLELMDQHEYDNCRSGTIAVLRFKIITNKIYI